MSDTETGGTRPAAPAPASAHLVERAAALLRADARLRTAPVPADADDAAPHDAEPGVAAAQAAPSPLVRAGEIARPIRDAAPAVAPAAAEATAATAEAPVELKQPPMLDIATLQRAGLMLTGGRSRIAEEYRISVSRALRALRGSRASRAGAANLLMVTSARPGEGKSFSALNLAASIAQNGLADVLLVDLDSKPRCLTALLGLGGREGLLDLATGTAGGNARPPETLIARTAIEGLSFMPVGARRARRRGRDHPRRQHHAGAAQPALPAPCPGARHRPLPLHQRSEHAGGDGR